ncbi:MAG: sporulation protein YunB [Ruminococcaceae bacterium]|nr:sporulation protein YunB [Oscillospiraceae bacterium]
MVGRISSTGGMCMRRFIRRVVGLLIILLLLLTVGFFYLRRSYRDVIRDLAETQVKNTTSDLTNDAIAKQIQDGVVQYDRIVYFEKDLDGRITALKTNIGEVNRLKTDILNIINDEILALDNSDIGIPLGSLFLPELFSGRGPAIPVHILSIRNSDANFVSFFSQAGINQTLHQVIMEVSIDVSVLVLGQTTSFTMESQVVVAETVIVGDVPNTFLQTGGTYGSEKENG